MIKAEKKSDRVGKGGLTNITFGVFFRLIQ